MAVAVAMRECEYAIYCFAFHQSRMWKKIWKKNNENLYLASCERILDFCMCRCTATVLRSWIESGHHNESCAQRLQRLNVAPQKKLQCEHLNASDLCFRFWFSCENGGGNGCRQLDRHQMDEFLSYFFFFITGKNAQVISSRPRRFDAATDETPKNEEEENSLKIAIISNKL